MGKVLCYSVFSLSFILLSGVQAGAARRNDCSDLICPRVDGKHPVYGSLPDCSKFCQCSNGKAYLQNCPAGLHFNSKLNVCDWPSNAGCSEKDCEKNNGRNTGNSTNNNNHNNTTSNITKNVCNSTVIKCPAVDGPRPVYAALPNCTQFCQCSNGKAYLQTCPAGLQFNSKLDVCDWSSNGDGKTNSTGGKDNGKPTGHGTDSNKNSTIPNTTKNVCNSSVIKCPAVDGPYPVYAALPNCSQFCQCSNGKAYLQNCPAGLQFNPKLNVCDWSRNGDGKTNSTGGKDNWKPTGHGTDNNKNSTIPNTTKNVCNSSVIKCPAVDGPYPVYAALPNCSQFCQCSNGKANLQTCPTGLHFNSNLNVCDRPKHAKCNSKVEW